MYHIFNVEIAAEIGVYPAIIFENIVHWIKVNEANGVNFFEGTYWTYNSIKAFESIFPYLSTKQIRVALSVLIEKDLIKTGNFNVNPYDRTLWYALTKKGITACRIGNLHLPDKENTFALKGKSSYTDINTYINTDINIKKERKKSGTFDEIISEYTNNDELKAALIEFIKMRKLLKKPVTDGGLKRLLNKLSRLAVDDMEKIIIVNQSIMNSWAGFFEVKEKERELLRPETEDEKADRELTEKYLAMLKGGASD